MSTNPTPVSALRINWSPEWMEVLDHLSCRLCSSVATAWRYAGDDLGNIRCCESCAARLAPPTAVSVPCRDCYGSGYLAPVRDEERTSCPWCQGRGRFFRPGKERTAPPDDDDGAPEEADFFLWARGY